MNVEEFRNHCISKAGVTESFPFDDITLVFKVGGKMFALAGIEPFERINLKCDPAIAIELREKFSAVIEGYHMNKKHWNTVYISEDASMINIKEWIDNSYDLV